MPAAVSGSGIGSEATPASKAAKNARFSSARDSCQKPSDTKSATSATAARVVHNLRMKLVVIVVLLAILASLGSGLYFLVKDKDDSRRVLNALTVRIVLSVVLFILLIVAWWAGLIQPNAGP